MAFTRGQHITAIELNNINAGVVINYTVTLHDGDLIGGIKFSSPQYYCRGTGKIVRGWSSYGAFGGAEMYLQKLENNNWVTVETIGKESDLFGGSFDKTLNNNWGDGWFRVSGEGSVRVTLHATFYPAQKDCNIGELLTIYDDFSNSGNRLTGTLITDDLLNQGKGGTF